jgi:CHASE1-domain containing sensor protein
MPKPTAHSVQAELIQFKEANSKEHSAVEKKVDDLQNQIKENRAFFTERLDRLDSRLWLIMLGTVTTLVTVLAALLGAV